MLLCIHTHVTCEVIGGPTTVNLLQRGALFNKKGAFEMAGTVTGGKKAAAKNLAKDPNFYAKIGKKGGHNGRTGGFAANPELARIAGAKGGRISRRRKTDAAA